MTDKEVTRALALIDKPTTDQPRTTGPFSVFRVQSEHTQSDLQPESWFLGEAERPPAQRDNDFSQSKDLGPAAQQHPTFEIDDPRWMSLSLTRGLGMLSDEDSSMALNERDVHEIEDESDNSNESSVTPTHAGLLDRTDRTDSNTSDDYPSNWKIVGSTGLTRPRDHVDQEIESLIPLGHNGLALQIPSTMKLGAPSNTLSYSLGYPQIKDPSVNMLIHHYTNNIVHLMQPVSHRENPFQTLYLPLAIEGSSFTEIDQDSEGISPATVAVFHSLLCSAATNLQGLGSRDSGLQQLAYRHKERALNALRNSLARKVGRYKDLMVAILSLVSVDVGL
jgi:arginine metabolism regulation protein II